MRTPAQIFASNLRVGANIAGNGKLFPLFAKDSWETRQLSVEYFAALKSQGFTHVRAIMPTGWFNPRNWWQTDSYIAAMNNAKAAGLRSFLAVTDFCDDQSYPLGDTARQDAYLSLVHDVLSYCAARLDPAWTALAPINEATRSSLAEWLPIRDRVYATARGAVGPNFVLVWAGHSWGSIESTMECSAPPASDTAYQIAEAHCYDAISHDWAASRLGGFAQWGKDLGIPVMLGEYGLGCDPFTPLPPDQQKGLAQTVITAADASQVPVTLWTFGTDSFTLGEPGVDARCESPALASHLAGMIPALPQSVSLAPEATTLWRSQPGAPVQATITIRTTSARQVRYAVVDRNWRFYENWRVVETSGEVWGETVIQPMIRATGDFVKVQCVDGDEVVIDSAQFMMCDAY